jgi:hypothetical protein
MTAIAKGSQAVGFQLRDDPAAADVLAAEAPLHEVGIPRVVDQQLFSDTDLSKSYNESLREPASSGLGHDQLCIRPAAVIQKAKRRVGIEAEA